MREIEREVERKYDVPALFALPDVTGESTGVASSIPSGTFELAATYFDTEDLRLAREKVTLRRRTGGEDDGWHLKLPLAGGAREELRWDSSDAAGDEVPPGPAALVVALARGAPLRPVATLATRRSAFRLLDAEQRELAELVDDEVSVLADDSVVGRWREVEVELREGDEAILDRVGGQLVAAGAAPAAGPSKAARALGPRAAAPPDLPPPGPVAPDAAAREALAAVLRTYGRAFLTQDPGVRLDRPDAVHQMRVAARRLRSSLRTFGPLLDPAPASELASELRWIAGELGPARDAEVLLARLERQLAELPKWLVVGPVAQLLERALHERTRRGREALCAAMESERYLALLERLVAFAASPPTTGAADEPAGRVVPRLVGIVVGKLDRAVAKLGRDASDEQVHGVRIRAKRARYAADAARLVLGESARELASQLARVTDVLGDHNDAAVAADVLYQLATRSAVPSGSAFTLGVLHGRQSADREALRRHFAEVWAEAGRKRYRRWLRA